MRYLHTNSTMLIPPKFQKKADYVSRISDYDSSKLILILWQSQIFLYKWTESNFSL